MDELRESTPLEPPAEPVRSDAAAAHPPWASALAVLRGWQQEHPPCDDQHQHLVLAGAAIEDLIRKSDYSIEAKTVGRALLCVNCRRLDATHGKCSGQPLETCPLLNGSFHAA